MTRPAFVDPDYWVLLGGQEPPPQPPAKDLYVIRNQTNSAVKAASDAMTYPASMTESIGTAVSTDGSEFSITRFVPLSAQKDNGLAQRAVVFAFGGGMIAGSVEINRNIIANFAETSQTQVYAPDYRLAPEHPFPAALEDVYSTVIWLQAHASEFNVDPARIVLFGMSSGGNLAAATALKARDEALDPPIAAQILRYPMLDDQTKFDPEDPRFPYLTWSPSSNAIVWNAYLSKSSKNLAKYATPGRAQDLHGLPPAHIGVGGLDLFRDEDTSYAMKLASQDVSVQFNLYPGVPHGFDGNPAFTLKRELWDNEARFIRKF